MSNKNSWPRNLYCLEWWWKKRTTTDGWNARDGTKTTFVWKINNEMYVCLRFGVARTLVAYWPNQKKWPSDASILWYS